MIPFFTICMDGVGGEPIKIMVNLNKLSMVHRAGKTVTICVEGVKETVLNLPTFEAAESLFHGISKETTKTTP